MNNICKKTLVIGIILLLIGVSVSSAISVDNKPVLSQDESEDCIDCRELSNAEFVKVKQLINRVEVYSKLLMVLSKDNPELQEISDKLSDSITTVKEELTEEQPFPYLCKLLEVILINYAEIFSFIVDIINNNPSLEDILELSLLILNWFIGYPLMLVAIILECDWRYSY